MAGDDWLPVMCIYDLHVITECSQGTAVTCAQVWSGWRWLTTCDVYECLTCDIECRQLEMIDYLWCVLMKAGYCYHLYTGLKWLEMIDYLWCVLMTYLWLQSAGRVLLSHVHRTEVAGDDWLPVMCINDLPVIIECRQGTATTCTQDWNGWRWLTTCYVYWWLTCDYRVQAGYCYHLYTGLKWLEMIDYLPPEMLRTRLEELCLQIKVRFCSSSSC